MFYPGGIVRMFTDLSKLSKKWIQNIKIRIKEYRYGQDEQ